MVNLMFVASLDAVSGSAFKTYSIKSYRYKLIISLKINKTENRLK